MGSLFSKSCKSIPSAAAGKMNAPKVMQSKNTLDVHRPKPLPQKNTQPGQPPTGYRRPMPPRKSGVAANVGGRVADMAGIAAGTAIGTVVGRKIGDAMTTGTNKVNESDNEAAQSPPATNTADDYAIEPDGRRDDEQNTHADVNDLAGEDDGYYLPPEDDYSGPADDDHFNDQGDDE